MFPNIESHAGNEGWLPLVRTCVVESSAGSTALGVQTALQADAFVGFSSAEVERISEALYAALGGAIRSAFAANLHCRPCSSQAVEGEPDDEGIGPEFGHCTCLYQVLGNA